MIHIFRRKEAAIGHVYRKIYEDSPDLDLSIAHLSLGRDAIQEAYLVAYYDGFHGRYVVLKDRASGKKYMTASEVEEVAKKILNVWR